MFGEGDGVRLEDQHFYHGAQNTLLDPHQEVLAEEMGGQRVCEVGGSSKQMELDWRGTDKENALMSEMLELIDIPVHKRGGKNSTSKYNQYGKHPKVNW